MIRFRNRRAFLVAIMLIFSALWPSAIHAENEIYEKIFPQFSERQDVTMRYLGPEAYESLPGVQYIGVQARSLAENSIGNVKSAVILTSTSQSSTDLAITEFNKFKAKYKNDMRLLMRTREGHEDRQTWLYECSGEPNTLIIINRNAQTLTACIMTGE